MSAHAGDERPHDREPFPQEFEDLFQAHYVLVVSERLLPRDVVETDAAVKAGTDIKAEVKAFSEAPRRKACHGPHSERV